MDKILIDGVWYHARAVLDNSDDETSELELVLDENGVPIPADVCLCAAWEPSECLCGAWDNIDPNVWYRD